MSFNTSGANDFLNNVLTILKISNGIFLILAIVTKVLHTTGDYSTLQESTNLQYMGTILVFHGLEKHIKSHIKLNHLIQKNACLSKSP